MLEWIKGKIKGESSSTPPLDIDQNELSGLRPNQYYLLDVRDLKAYRQGHIKGSHLIPYQELNGRMHEVPTDRLIVTVDGSVRRSRQAAKLLRTGALDARSLKGGMAGWTGKLVK